MSFYTFCEALVTGLIMGLTAYLFYRLRKNKLSIYIAAPAVVAYLVLLDAIFLDFWKLITVQVPNRPDAFSLKGLAGAAVFAAVWSLTEWLLKYSFPKPKPRRHLKVKSV